MRVILAFALGTLFLTATITAAQEKSPFHKGEPPYTLAPRFALVIGVSSVSESGVFGSLPNPIHDAEEITKALRAIGFSVIAPHENYEPEQITRQIIKRSLYDFALLLKETKGAVGLVYFSGHGIELYGEDYLVGYDGYVRFDRDLYEELIPMVWFYDAFRYAGNNLNLLFIDACRNFPWTDLQSFGTAVRLDTKLLQSANVLKAYATLSGRTALDGKGNTSPYAAAFLDSLKQPDITLSEFLSAISRHVQKYAPALQVPVADAVGVYDFMFLPTVESFNQEFMIFNTANLSKNRALLGKITTKYAYGYFARSAEDLLKTIPATSPSPSQFVELRSQASIRQTPSGGGHIVAVLDAGTQLGVIDQLVGFAGKQWVPVLGPTGEPAYVDVKVTARTKLLSVSHEMRFQPGTTAGTESLSQEALESLKAALQEKLKIRRIEVTGYIYNSEPLSSPAAAHRLLARQATVMQALEEAGYKTDDVSVPVLYTTDSDKEDSVELVVTVAKREP